MLVGLVGLLEHRIMYGEIYGNKDQRKVQVDQDSHHTQKLFPCVCRPCSKRDISLLGVASSELEKAV